MSDITFEPNTDIEVDPPDFDALVEELTNGVEPQYDLSGLYPEGGPDLSAEDTQEAEVDPQDMEAWLDSLEPSSLDMDL